MQAGLDPTNLDGGGAATPSEHNGERNSGRQKRNEDGRRKRPTKKSREIRARPRLRPESRHSRSCRALLDACSFG